MYKVAIVGGGVVGALIARKLAHYDMSIVILEKENDVATGQSKANSGIVHAGYDPKPGTLKARLNVLGSNLMEQICKELGVKYRRNGALVVGYTDDDSKRIEELYERGSKNGAAFGSSVKKHIVTAFLACHQNSRESWVIRFFVRS